jgi:hypothetical protein
LISKPEDEEDDDDDDDEEEEDDDDDEETEEGKEGDPVQKIKNLLKLSDENCSID